jgi:hypothetical protein
VYKGGGKARNKPASYRPVAILCAMSKVLETVAKEDLDSDGPKTFSAEYSAENYRPKIIGRIFGQNEYSASAAENEKNLF